ncbi:hypothetical protein [Rhizobium grahamii]|uniref:Helix-turn-helix domain-containing protein n=1 Tax=Rhizobium grahamii CCGE 502 TaxID=990285 RepID=S3HK59_9HYPH|nr:hypothetical protein [Rhizobium grahamii]EPE98445.1 hypothetical protein RGCCGE502_08460 [Rhizobium grahamii CCGE 502]
MTEKTESFDLIWGAEAIAKAIGKTKRATFHLLENGDLAPARKIGGRWVVDRRLLQRFFMGEAA